MKSDLYEIRAMLCAVMAQGTETRIVGILLMGAAFYFLICSYVEGRKEP